MEVLSQREIDNNDAHSQLDLKLSRELFDRGSVNAMLNLYLNLSCQYVVSVCVVNLVRVSIRSFYLKPIPHNEPIKQ